jgi:hypothetical protein
VAYAIESESEYDHVIAPSMNMIVMIEPNCEKSILEFKLISSAKNYPKFNTFPRPPLTLSLKITKWPPRNNSIFQGLSQYTKISPQFS